jgi:hypothetical protein
MPPRKDLGSLLVDEEVLDAKDLERVRERRPLWSALIDAELATAEQIFRALSARFGVPVVSDDRLGDVTVPEPLRRILPRSEALTLGILPVDLTPDGQRATVVMIDPSDEATLAELLTRAQIPEGRALLGRREALQRAIDRCLGGGDTAVVAPLPAPRRTTGRFAPIKPAIEPPPPPPPPTPPPIPALKPVGDNDVTGTVKLDPQLQAELQKLPPRALTADPLTPLPRPRPKRPTPPSSPSDASEPIKPETPSEALRAEERLTRALIETVEALATELERHLGAAGQGSEMARLARRVARQLNLGRRAADEIGVAAQLFAVDRALRAVDGAAAADVFSELGWAASGDGGLLPVLRALTAASAGFGRAPARWPIISSSAPRRARSRISTPCRSCCARRRRERRWSTRSCACSRPSAATSRPRSRRRCRRRACSSIPSPATTTKT